MKTNEEQREYNRNRQAKYRATSPQAVKTTKAYRQSERGRETARAATARWRAKHPQEKKPPPLPIDNETWRFNYMRKWKADKQGFLVCVEFPPPPADSRCQKCRAHTKLHLDHDHETGAFRGWLCLKCNMGIGQLGDTREGLQTAIAYLNNELPWQARPFPSITGLLGFGA